MRKKNRTGYILYLILSFIPMWALSCLYYFHRDDRILLLMMLLPAAASVITRLITREGFSQMMLRPHFKGNLKWYFSSYFAPPFIAYAGALLYFLLFRDSYSPLHSLFAAQESITSMSEYRETLAVLIPLAILVNPLAGILQCFGEELGWRGYLFPKLQELMSPLLASIITGAIWGLWHAPIIAMGYNYGTEHPITGIFAMMLFCVVLGIIIGYTTNKVGSIWPAVLFHASVNGMGKWAPSDLFMSTEPRVFIGPDLTGVIGGIGFFVLSIFLAGIMIKQERKAANTYNDGGSRTW